MDNNFYDQALKAVSLNGAPSPTAPAVANYLRSSFAAIPSDNLASAGKGIGSQQEAARKEALAIELERKKKEAELLEKNLAGEDWRQIKKEDGGFDYEDALGNKVNLWTFSKFTGKDPRKLLEDSDNMLDKQFVQDWDDTQELMKAYAGGRQNEYWSKLEEDYINGKVDVDPAQIREKIEAEGGPSSILQRFKQHYPNVFSQQGRGEVNRRFSR